MNARTKLIAQCKNLLREIVFYERGRRCEFCGRTSHLGLFHIIAVSQAPRIQLYKENVLIACWMPCHYSWHHYGPNNPRTIEIEKKIRTLRGDDYLDRLMALNFMAEKLTELYLRNKLIQLKEELKKYAF